MSNKRETYTEVKQLLEEITHELKDPNLTPKQRSELQHHAAALAGMLLHPWFPVDWGRRLIMVAIVLLGLQQAYAAGNYEPLLWWLLLPFFSPRLMGEAAYFWGRMRGP